MIAYDIESLVKIYPGQAVPANKNISFQVREGEIFGILDQSGAGKTPLIKQMVNLLVPSSGSI